jgi:hypothetical protein
MFGKKLALSLCSLLALTFASQTLLAQRRVDHFPRSPRVTPMEATAPSLKIISTNLGPTPTNAYDAASGFYVLGPASFYGQAQWVGVQFTPKVNSTVTQLQVAVGYQFGAKGIIVGLNSDSSGNVGTSLASSANATIPDFGTCCKLVTVNIPPTAVSAGTPYWVSVTSDDVNAPDFVGVWAQSNLPNNATSIDEATWSAFSGYWSAYAVRGTVP